MTYLLYPTHFECIDTELKQDIFTVKAFDESAAEVGIDMLVNVKDWDEIAPLIRKALLALKLEGDKTK